MELAPVPLYCRSQWNRIEVEYHANVPPTGGSAGHSFLRCRGLSAVGALWFTQADDDVRVRLIDGLGCPKLNIRAITFIEITEQPHVARLARSRHLAASPPEYCLVVVSKTCPCVGWLAPPLFAASNCAFIDANRALRAIWLLLRDTLEGFVEDNALSRGGSIAYFTLFSIAPVLLVVIAIAGLAYGRDAAEGAIVKQLSGLMGQDTATALQSMIESAGRPHEGVIASIVWPPVPRWRAFQTI